MSLGELLVFLLSFFVVGPQFDFIDGRQHQVQEVMQDVEIFSRALTFCAFLLV
jgi:hypothetical protein